MKRIQLVIHRIDNKYYNEYYEYNTTTGDMKFIPIREGQKYHTDDLDIYELYHGKEYSKVKSPYNGLMLYGRYINISSRISDEIARF